MPPFTALTGAFGGGEDAANQPPHRQADALARLLLEHGANPNDAQTLYNRQFGASDDHLELLFAFGLGRGDGDPWQHRLDGRIATPRQMLEDQLVAAAAHDYPSRVRLLLSHGVAADGVGTRHPIFHARRAIEIATRNGATGIVELLRDAGADPVTLDPVDELLAACMRADHAATAATDRAIVEQAIERDPGRIVEAAELGRHDTIRLLVDLGWDINARTRRTALHEAAYRGERALVDLLLSLGASPTIRDTSFNVTAAGWAEHNHHLELANYLTEREAGHR